MEASAETSFKKQKRQDGLERFKRQLKIKLGPSTLFDTQFDLRFCSLIFPLPLISVYKCCFKVPRSEINWVRFTKVMWNKATEKKRRACRDFRAQNQLAHALTCQLDFCLVKWKQPLFLSGWASSWGWEILGRLGRRGRKSGKGVKSETWKKKGTDLSWWVKL